MHKVCFIGAGPGDPENLTLRGARLLEGCGSVFAPRPYEETFASLLSGKRVLVPFDFDFDELVELVESLRREGDVGFLVPGDLAFYSPFQPLIDFLGERALVVPGVGVANAASGVLKKTFHMSGIANRALLLSPRVLEEDGGPSLRELASPGTTLVIYMNTLPLPELVSQLREGYGSNVPIALLHRLGLPGQAVVRGTLDDIVEKIGDRDFFNRGDSGCSSLTLTVAGETLDAAVAGRCWDRRRQKCWAKSP